MVHETKQTRINAFSQSIEINCFVRKKLFNVDFVIFYSNFIYLGIIEFIWKNNS